MAYYSKILSKPEGQYCVTRREFLAIVQSIKHFDHYLYGTQLLVRTDHGALNWLLYFKNPGQMVLRSWLHIILQFNIGRVGNITMLTVYPVAYVNPTITAAVMKEKTIKLQIKTR